MPKPSSTRLHQASLKTSLIERAFAILDQLGPNGVTIRAVARASGVSHAAPANHFADRRQLQTEMAILILDQLLSDVERRSSVEPDRARAYLLSLFEYSQSWPHRYDLLWRKDLVNWEDPQLAANLEEAYQDFIQSLIRRSPRVNSGGEDIETLGTALWAMVHGYAQLRSTRIFEARTDKATGERRIDAMLSLLLGAVFVHSGS